MTPNPIHSADNAYADDGGHSDSGAWVRDNNFICDKLKNELTIYTIVGIAFWVPRHVIGNTGNFSLLH